MPGEPATRSSGYSSQPAASVNGFPTASVALAPTMATTLTTASGADLPLRGRSTNAEDCPLAVIRALAACTFKTRALTDFALFNHLIRAGAAVAGYAGLEAADFPVKLVLGYIGID